MSRFRKNKGVITAFISIMLVSILSLGTLVIEAGRFQIAKNQLSEATTSAGTSMIASYDALLYERYGLLAIDTQLFTPDRCREYVEFNADLTGEYAGNRVSRLYTVSNIELEGLYNLTYPSVLKRQILTRAKYHVIPQDYALNLYNVDSFLAELQNKCIYVADCLEPVANGSTVGSISDVNADMLDALTKLYEIFDSIIKYDDRCSVILTPNTVSILPSVTGTVESNVSIDDINAIQDVLNNANTLLGSGAADLMTPGRPFSQTDVTVDVSFLTGMTDEIKDVSSISDVPNTAQTYAANCRDLAYAVNAAINLLSDDKEGNLLLNSYITQYFSNRNYNVQGYAGPGRDSGFAGENANFAAACVEYIFGGSDSEIANQNAAYNYVLAIRLINNLYSVLTNSSEYQADNAYSVLSHIAWAYYESCTDMVLLTEYTSNVPLNKYSMILNINDPATVESAFSSADFVAAMDQLGIYDGTDFRVAGIDNYSYRDSLALALWMVPNSQKLLRIADLIQLEMRYQEQHVEGRTATFLMSNQNTFCRVRCDGKLNSILPIVSLGSNSGVNGISFSSTKYVGY